MVNRSKVTRTRRLWSRLKRRKGAIALMTALLLTAILGMVACAFDIGWIAMTRTQLVAVADSSALAGGTELLDGLGLFATKTKSQVAAAAGPVAVEYASRNPNAAINNSLIDEDRDVEFGEAHWVEATEDQPAHWQRTTPPSGERDYYNYVRARAHRNVEGGASDGPVPLFFARIFGIDELPLEAVATAVILPANGFQVNEGSNDTANVMPFAFRRTLWERFKRAQEHYDANPGVFSDPDLLEIPDPMVTDPNDNDNRLFAIPIPQGTGGYQQIFYDQYTVTPNATNENTVSASGSPDGKLEIDIYPHNIDAGNFGTIDLGAGNNSTTDIVRQILNGLNDFDLSHYEDNQLVLSEEDPLDAEGDTGISAGIKSALEAVKGQCKAIALFTETNEAPGNNLVYTLVEFVGVTVVEVQLTSGSKKLLMQRCKLVDDNAIGDTEGKIGEDTTIFTPLILIE